MPFCIPVSEYNPEIHDILSGPDAQCSDCSISSNTPVGSNVRVFLNEDGFGIRTNVVFENVQVAGNTYFSQFSMPKQYTPVKSGGYIDDFVPVDFHLRTDAAVSGYVILEIVFPEEIYTGDIFLDPVSVKQSSLEGLSFSSYSDLYDIQFLGTSGKTVFAEINEIQTGFFATASAQDKWSEGARFKVWWRCPDGFYPTHRLCKTSGENSEAFCVRCPRSSSLYRHYVDNQCNCISLKTCHKCEGLADFECKEQMPAGYGVYEIQNSGEISGIPNPCLPNEGWTVGEELCENLKKTEAVSCCDNKTGYVSCKNPLSSNDSHGGYECIKCEDGKVKTATSVGVEYNICECECETGFKLVRTGDVQAWTRHYKCVKISSSSSSSSSIASSSTSGSSSTMINKCQDIVVDGQTLVGSYNSYKYDSQNEDCGGDCSAFNPCAKGCACVDGKCKKTEYTSAWCTYWLYCGHCNADNSYGNDPDDCVKKIEILKIDLAKEEGDVGNPTLFTNWSQHNNVKCSNLTTDNSRLQGQLFSYSENNCGLCACPEVQFNGKTIKGNFDYKSWNGIDTKEDHCKYEIQCRQCKNCSDVVVASVGYKFFDNKKSCSDIKNKDGIPYVFLCSECESSSSSSSRVDSSSSSSRVDSSSSSSRVDSSSSSSRVDSSSSSISCGPVTFNGESYEGEFESGSCKYLVYCWGCNNGDVKIVDAKLTSEQIESKPNCSDWGYYGSEKEAVDSCTSSSSAAGSSSTAVGPTPGPTPSPNQSSSSTIGQTTTTTEEPSTCYKCFGNYCLLSSGDPNDPNSGCFQDSNCGGIC